jgi:hypothetical protein
MKTRPEVIKAFMFNACHVIDKFAKYNYCYGNLRPENILIEMNLEATKAIHLVEDF